MIKMVDAHPMDAVYLAPRLRAIDALEVRCTGKTPEESLMIGFDLVRAKVLSALNSDEEVVAMCGVSESPQNPKAGVIWLLASDKFDEHKKDFLTVCKPVIEELSEGFQHVYNLVHINNTKSIRWLEWYGFTVEKHKTYEQGGEDFYLLVKET